MPSQPRLRHAQPVELLGDGAGSLDLHAIAGDRLLVGLQDHDALIAVEDHRLAAGYVGQKRPNPHHRWNLEPFRHDRRMAARAAQLSGKSLDKSPVEVGRFAGREIVGQHDHRLRNRRERLAALSQQVAEQALLDVINIVGPLRDVVVEILKHLRVAAERAAHGVFRPPIAVADRRGQLVLQLGVVEHRQVGIEDGGVLLAEFGPDRIAVSLDLPGGFGDGMLQPGELCIDGTPLHEPARNPEALAVEDERFTDRDAG